MWAQTSERGHLVGRVALCALLVLCAAAGAVEALGDIPFPGRRHPLWPERRLRFEVADAELFGIPGLRSSGVRATVPLWKAAVVVELVRTGSEVAAESRATLRLAAGVVAVEAGVERVVAGPRSAGLTSLGVMARLPAGARSALLFHAGGIGVGDTRDPGFDAGLVLQLRPVDAVAIEAAVSIHRRYGEHLRLAAEVKATAGLAMRAGFDAATETATAGICVSLRAIRFELDADVHAVLGLSQRVTLGWGH